MSKRLLASLKVAELRAELEKRGLDKSGVKQSLVDRLREYLMNEGRDPNEYSFDSSTQTEAKSDGVIEMLKFETSEDAVEVFYETPRPETQLTVVSEESMGAPEPSVGEEEDGSEQALLPKKTEDAAAFVVSVGENEEDLDYDLKDLKHSSSSDGPAKNRENPKSPHSSISSASKQQDKSSGRADKVSPTLEPSNLRISNLAMPTKAVDLKQIFSDHGKVLSAKILASTKSPGGCVGFVKMASAEDATSCILNLDGTEFNGNIIKIEATEEVPKAPSVVRTSKPTLTDKPKCLLPQVPVKVSLRERGRRMNARHWTKDATNVLKISRSNANPWKAEIIGRYKKSALVQSQLVRTLNRARYIARASSAGRQEAPPRYPNGDNRERIYQERTMDKFSNSRKYTVPYSAFKTPTDRPAYKRQFQSDSRQGHNQRWNSSETHFDEPWKSYPGRGRRNDTFAMRRDGATGSSRVTHGAIYRKEPPVPSFRQAYGLRSGEPYVDESRRFVKPVVYKRSPPDRNGPPKRFIAGDRRFRDRPYEKRPRYDTTESDADRRTSEHFSRKPTEPSPSYIQRGRPSERTGRHPPLVPQQWKSTAISTPHSRSRYPSTSARSRSPLVPHRSSPALPPPVRYTRPQTSAGVRSTPAGSRRHVCAPTSYRGHSRGRVNSNSTYRRPDSLMGAPPQSSASSNFPSSYRNDYHRNSLPDGFSRPSSTAPSSSSVRPETYLRRSLGDSGSHRTSQKPSSSVIDYGHRPGGSKTVGNWQSTQPYRGSYSSSASQWRSDSSGYNNSRSSRY